MDGGEKVPEKGKGFDHQAGKVGKCAAAIAAVVGPTSGGFKFSEFREGEDSHEKKRGIFQKEKI